jgi:hypothetical protein
MNRQALLILGMHRSGTSAIAGVVTRLGAQEPRTLLSADRYNELGYYESLAFVEFHDRLLSAGGSCWNDWTSFNTDKLCTTSAEWSVAWRCLLEQEFGCAPLFVVKDPRICRLLPFWLRNLADNDITPVAILAIRDPFEVARSLAVRNGFGEQYSLLLWLRHVLDAELETRKITRSIVSYQQLLVDWKAVAEKIAAETGVHWPEWSDATDAEISAFLKQDLRHHIADNGASPVASPLAQWVEQVSAALEELSRNGPRAEEPLRKIDDVRLKFDRVCRVFAPAHEEEARLNGLHVAALEAGRSHLLANIATLVTERNRAQALSTNLEAERSRIEQHALNLEAERSRIEQHALNLEAERSRIEQHALNLETERRRIEQHALNLDAERSRIEQHALNLETEATRREAHRMSLEQELNRLGHERDQIAHDLLQLRRALAASEKWVQALRASRSWRWTAPLRVVFDIWLRTISTPSR